MAPQTSAEKAAFLHGKGLDRQFFLPRLPLQYYRGEAVVHWTLPIATRAVGWLTEAFHSKFREVMLHAAAREGLICPTYCLMPDHIHLVWMGLRLDTDQRIGMKFLREHIGPGLKPYKFQHQAQDHVLREEERRLNAFVRVCNYIVQNPLRAELVKRPEQWAFTGAVVPGYPTLHPLNAEFWPTFWKIYFKARAPAAGNLVRPPLG